MAGWLERSAELAGALPSEAVPELGGRNCHMPNALTTPLQVLEWGEGGSRDLGEGDRGQGQGQCGAGGGGAGTWGAMRALLGISNAVSMQEQNARAVCWGSTARCGTDAGR